MFVKSIREVNIHACMHIGLNKHTEGLNKQQNINEANFKTQDKFI